MKVKIKTLEKLLEKIEDVKPYRRSDSFEHGVEVGLNSAKSLIEEVINQYKEL